MKENVKNAQMKIVYLAQLLLKFVTNVKIQSTKKNVMINVQKEHLFMEIHVINAQKIVLNVIVLNVLHVQKDYISLKINVQKNAEMDITQKMIKYVSHVLNKIVKYVKTINVQNQKNPSLQKMIMSFQNVKMDFMEMKKQDIVNHVLKDAHYVLLKMIVQFALKVIASMKEFV